MYKVVIHIIWGYFKFKNNSQVIFWKQRIKVEHFKSKSINFKKVVYEV